MNENCKNETKILLTFNKSVKHDLDVRHEIIKKKKCKIETAYLTSLTIKSHMLCLKCVVNHGGKHMQNPLLF